MQYSCSPLFSGNNLFELDYSNLNRLFKRLMVNDSKKQLILSIGKNKTILNYIYIHKEILNKLKKIRIGELNVYPFKMTIEHLKYYIIWCNFDIPFLNHINKIDMIEIVGEVSSDKALLGALKHCRPSIIYKLLL